MKFSLIPLLAFLPLLGGSCFEESFSDLFDNPDSGNFVEADLLGVWEVSIHQSGFERALVATFEERNQGHVELTSLYDPLYDIEYMDPYYGYLWHDFDLTPSGKLSLTFSAGLYDSNLGENFTATEQYSGQMSASKDDLSGSVLSTYDYEFSGQFANLGTFTSTRKRFSDEDLLGVWEVWVDQPGDIRNLIVEFAIDYLGSVEIVALYDQYSNFDYLDLSSGYVDHEFSFSNEGELEMSFSRISYDSALQREILVTELFTGQMNEAFDSTIGSANTTLDYGASGVFEIEGVFEANLLW